MFSVAERRLQWAAPCSIERRRLILRIAARPSYGLATENARRSCHVHAHGSHLRADGSPHRSRPGPTRLPGVWSTVRPTELGAQSRAPPTLLLSGRVLVAGGYEKMATLLASVELYASWYGHLDDDEVRRRSAPGPYGDGPCCRRQSARGRRPRLCQSGVALGRGLQTGPPAHGRQQVPCSRRGFSTPRRCCPAARSLVPEGPTGATCGGRKYTTYRTRAVAATDVMATARAGHTATLLASGKVLVAGGAGNGSAELYEESSRKIMGPRQVHSLRRVPPLGNAAAEWEGPRGGGVRCRWTPLDCGGVRPRDWGPGLPPGR